MGPAFCIFNLSQGESQSRVGIIYHLDHLSDRKQLTPSFPFFFYLSVTFNFFLQLPLLLPLRLSKSFFLFLSWDWHFNYKMKTSGRGREADNLLSLINTLALFQHGPISQHLSQAERSMPEPCTHLSWQRCRDTMRCSELNEWALRLMSVISVLACI